MRLAKLRVVASIVLTRADSRCLGHLLRGHLLPDAQRCYVPCVMAAKAAGSGTPICQLVCVSCLMSTVSLTDRFS